ncbi:tRNA-specific adenosine deaminase [Maioricimonas rarisocia]|uniref:tRNA-specific adenosine deaminase n=1 Tax=Maioricimonas rarisocia TaxID=2528026 RepID=A0A517YZW3_9PLAN|nr:anti-phage dCTP deaminase [Maioricimonas rarisocia]QDU35778.1 tRNA-specific adenosine deaminase [Maioricimonas rarisocia]
MAKKRSKQSFRKVVRKPAKRKTPSRDRSRQHRRKTSRVQLPRTEDDALDLVEELHALDSELVIGLVGAVGTDLNRVSDLLAQQLSLTGYNVRTIKISREVIPLFGTIEYPEQDEYARIAELMTAGNAARQMSGDNSILALGAASIIAAEREIESPIPERTAVIVNSLKRPEEVERLRKIYPGGFVMLGVHTKERRRIRNLTNLGMSWDNATDLVRRDAAEDRVPHGQRLRKTFYLSDFFVRFDGNEDPLRGELRRIVELLFGFPYHTPTFDEFAMFLAFSAALRSADLSRQVGAVVARDEQILATGANDCPKAGGGLYWPRRDDDSCLSDAEDGRDYKRGVDSNRKEQLRIIEEIERIARDYDLDADRLHEVLTSKGCPIGDLTEYGRVVHAEMDALTSCARAGISTSEATLYSTTFPCHNCAKHIIAAGVRRVVYIEPYEKSKAQTFHEDAVIFEGAEPAAGKVVFEAFSGIGPRRFFDLFSMNLSSGYDILRKDKESGHILNWNVRTAALRLQMLPATFRDLEKLAASMFERMRTQDGTNDA